jgi:predicted membrane protein
MPFAQFLLALLGVVAAAWLIHTYPRMPENIGRIVTVVLALLLVGMALWLINAYVPMAGSIKAILNITVVVAACVRVLEAFGLWNQVVRCWRNLVTKHPRGSQIG